jgi:predicted Zn-dependent peptidase
MLNMSPKPIFPVEVRRKARVSRSRDAGAGKTGISDFVTHMNFGSTLVHNASVDFINLSCGTSAL